MEDGTAARRDFGQPAARGDRWRQARPEKQAEENDRLIVELARARGVLSSATEHAIITFDISGRITDWNRGAELILGRARSTVLGHPGEFLFSDHKHHLAAFREDLAAANQHGVTVRKRLVIRPDGTSAYVHSTMTPLIEMGSGLIGFLCILQQTPAARVDGGSENIHLHEARHRLKNMISVVRSLVHQTETSAATIQEYRDGLLSKLAAISEANDLLDGYAQSVTLCELTRSILKPYGEVGSRIYISGAGVEIGSEGVTALAIVLQELATNAAKYGALSCAGGRVDVSWEMLAPDGQFAPLLELAWCESGGPPVTPPTRRGFGTRLLERGVTQGPHETARLTFRPEGVEYRTWLRAVAVADSDQSERTISPPPS